MPGGPDAFGRARLVQRAPLAPHVAGVGEAAHRDDGRVGAEGERPCLGHRRGAGDLERAAWRDRGEAVAWLGGQRLGAGITAELLARLGAAPDDRPLLDTLLMLAPALVQCAAAMSEAWPLAFRTDSSVVAMGGLTDSCYMWRRGGALDRARAAEGHRTP